MRHLLPAILLSSFVMCFSTLVIAAPIIDQNQPNSPRYMASFAADDLAQSFQQTNSNISGAGIFLQSNVGTTDIVTIALWNALPNQAGAQMLASGSGLATSGSWVDVSWDVVDITAGATYYLVFTSQNRTLGIAGDISNPYADGEVHAWPGFQEFPTFDYTFRTYFDDNRQAPVPEPSTVLLLGAGLAGICGLRRRLSKKGNL